MTKNPKQFSTALGGVKVIDLSDQKGAYCTKLLADLGADVIKVEPPNGVHTRYIGPFFHDECHPDKSLCFFNLNTNKRSITLDLDTLEGRKSLRKLIKWADIMVETFPPGYLNEIELSYPVIREINPCLILTSITGFGQAGPYSHFKAVDITGQAMGGLMYLTGFPDTPPLRIYGSQAYYLASLNGAVATLSALFCREFTGEGQLIDVSMQESVSAAMEKAMLYYDLRHEICKRMTIISEQYPHDLFLPGRNVYKCRDGKMVLCLMYNYRWPTVVDWMDIEGMAADLKEEKWQKVLATAGNREISLELSSDPAKQEQRTRELKHIEDVFQCFVAAHRANEFIEEAQRRGIDVAPVNSAEDLVRDQQLQARGYFVYVEHPELGMSLRYPGAPYRLSRTPCRIIRRAPLIGEHNTEIYNKRLGLIEEETQLRDIEVVQGSNKDVLLKKERRYPLEGIRVLDFTRFIAGALTTKLLADHGAEVIKVESMTHLDRLRISQPIAKAKTGDNSVNLCGYFNNVNTSKSGISLNMNHPKARDIVEKLVKRCDVVIDNFPPRVMQKWRLTYNDLLKLKADIIAVNMPAQGLVGPHKHHRAFGFSLQALGGLTYLTGYPDRPPKGPGLNYTNYSSGPYHAAVAIIAALFYRQKTGQGQCIEISQFEAAVSVLETAILEYTVNNRVQFRMGNHFPYAAPHNAYRCKGDDRWCTIAVFTDKEWLALCQVVGHPEWRKDERFSTLPARKKNEDELDRLLEEWTIDRKAEEVMILLQKAGVAAGVVQNARDIFVNDPQLKARGHYVYLNHPEAGLTAYDGIPFKMSATPGELRSPAPCLGEHNDYVYGRLLGLSEAEINQYIIEGVFD